MAGIWASSVLGAVSAFGDSQTRDKLSVTRDTVDGFGDIIKEQLAPLSPRLDGVQEVQEGIGERLDVLELMPKGYVATLIRNTTDEDAGSAVITGANARTVAILLQRRGAYSYSRDYIFFSLRTPEQTQKTETVYPASFKPVTLYNSWSGYYYRTLSVTSGGGNWAQYKVTWGAGYTPRMNNVGNRSAAVVANAQGWIWRIDREA